MYHADDVLLMSKSIEGLQILLNAIERYCKRWQLKFNISKTKILCVKRGMLNQEMKDGTSMEMKSPSLIISLTLVLMLTKHTVGLSIFQRQSNEGKN